MEREKRICWKFSFFYHLLILSSSFDSSHFTPEYVQELDTFRILQNSNCFFFKGGHRLTPTKQGVLKTSIWSSQFLAQTLPDKPFNLFLFLCQYCFDVSVYVCVNHSLSHRITHTHFLVKAAKIPHRQIFHMQPHLLLFTKLGRREGAVVAILYIDLLLSE